MGEQAAGFRIAIMTAAESFGFVMGEQAAGSTAANNVAFPGANCVGTTTMGIMEADTSTMATA